MSLKTADVQGKDWRFDLVTEATGVPFNYEYDTQLVLNSDFTANWEEIKTVSLVHEDGFKTAVINSLFLDRRAEEDDPVPKHIKDLRGWPGDGFFINGDRIGSKLWMLKYIGKQTGDPADPLLKWSKAWTQQSLQWFIDDGICDHIDVTTWYPRPEFLRIDIQMFQNDNLIFRSQWENYFNDVADSNT